MEKLMKCLNLDSVSWHQFLHRQKYTFSYQAMGD